MHNNLSKNQNEKSFSTHKIISAQNKPLRLHCVTCHHISRDREQLIVNTVHLMKLVHEGGCMSPKEAAEVEIPAALQTEESRPNRMTWKPTFLKCSL